MIDLQEFQNKNEVRSFPLSFDEDTNTVDVVFSTGERVYRSAFRPYFEELEISNDAINLSRMNNGAPILDSHKYDSVRDIIGVVESSKVSRKRSHCDYQIF